MSATVVPELASLTAKTHLPVVSAQLRPYNAVITRKGKLPAATVSGLHRVEILDLPNDIANLAATVSRGRVQNVEQGEVCRPRRDVDPMFSVAEQEIREVMDQLRKVDREVRLLKLKIENSNEKKSFLQKHIKAQLGAVPRDGFSTESFSPPREEQIRELLTILETALEEAENTKRDAEVSLRTTVTTRELLLQRLHRLMQGVAGSNQFSDYRSAQIALMNASVVTVCRVIVTVEIPANHDDVELQLVYKSCRTHWNMSALVELDTKFSKATRIASTARIIQTTGEDWENVRISLSTDSMDQFKEIPTIPAEFVSFAPEGESTGGGCSTRYPEQAGAKPGTCIIQVPELVSIRSSTTERHVPLQTLTDVPAYFYRTAAPTKSTSVYLKAMLRCPAHATMFGGDKTDATLKLDNASIGEITLHGTPDGKIYFDIGPDPAITMKVVPLKRVDTQAGSLVTTKTKRREEEITTYLANFNNADMNTKIALLAAIPKSTNAKISVTLVDPKTTPKSIVSIDEHEAICEAIEKSTVSPDFFMDEVRGRLITVLSVEYPRQTSVTIKYAIEHPVGHDVEVVEI